MTIRTTTAFKSSVSNVFVGLRVFLVGHFTIYGQRLTQSTANKYVANSRDKGVIFPNGNLTREIGAISRFFIETSAGIGFTMNIRAVFSYKIQQLFI